MSTYKNKAEIRRALIKNLDNDQIKLSAMTVGAAVSFWVERGIPEKTDYVVRCEGFATLVEREIKDIDQLVDHLWQNRKRIL